MVYTYTSRLVTAILFSDVDAVLQGISGSSSITYSPMYHTTTAPPQFASYISIELPRKHIILPILFKGFNSSETTMMHSYFVKSTHHLRSYLQMVFKVSISSALYHPDTDLPDFTPWMEISILAGERGTEKILICMLPFDFFWLFSRNINISERPDALVEKILHYFLSPLWMVPDVRIISTSLTQAEFAKLLNHLQKKNLLTPYQIFLLTLGFPELSGFIKGSLSKNSIEDVLALKKVSGKLKLGKRDIIGGIYSIEESIFFIMNKEDDLEYSLFLKRLQRLISFTRNLIVLSRKRFREHISEMIQENLLLPVFSTIEDRILGIAFSMDFDHSFELAKSGLSDRKQRYIAGHITNEYPFIDVLSARASVLKQYRSIKIKKTGTGEERLGYLLSCLEGTEDYQNLLLAVGWFQISTAMKGLNPGIVNKLTSSLPEGARILIEDVLSGTINPNILHDEYRVKKSKKACVETILDLYAEGTIALQC